MQEIIILLLIVIMVYQVASSYSNYDKLKVIIEELKKLNNKQ